MGESQVILGFPTARGEGQRPMLCKGQLPLSRVLGNDAHTTFSASQLQVKAPWTKALINRRHLTDVTPPVAKANITTLNIFIAEERNELMRAEG